MYNCYTMNDQKYITSLNDSHPKGFDKAKYIEIQRCPALKDLIGIPPTVIRITLG